MNGAWSPQFGMWLEKSPKDGGWHIGPLKTT